MTKKKKIFTHCYVFEKKKFTKKDIVKYLKYKKQPEIVNFSKTSRVYRINKSKFKIKSLRTKTIDKGVKVIKGVLK